MPCSPPEWCSQYVGIPFLSHGRDRSGCDCYGLCWLVMREQFGIEAPSYAGDYPDALEAAEVARLIADMTSPLYLRGDWRWLALSEPRAGDLVVMRIQGRPWHVGIIVARDWMLHVRPGANACLERLDSMRWRKRIVGFYRYAG
jgi:cell wall-associated NlpC family hydrolase